MRIVALQKYALGGKVPGPFFRNLPFLRPAYFLLRAWRLSAFPLPAMREAVFQLPAQSDDAFELGV